MKRTTYILIGLFIAGLCVLVGGMFMMFCLGRPYFSNQLNLQGEQLTKEVPVCRVIWLTQTEMSTEERSVWLANSSLEVTIWVSMRRWSVPKSMGFLTMSK